MSGEELEKLKKPAKSNDEEKEQKRIYNLAKLEYRLYK
jgi:hypothetical protein